MADLEIEKGGSVADLEIEKGGSVDGARKVSRNILESHAHFP